MHQVGPSIFVFYPLFWGQNLNICIVIVVFALVPASFLLSNRIPVLIVVVFVCSKLKTENSRNEYVL